MKYNIGSKAQYVDSSAYDIIIGIVKCTNDDNMYVVELYDEDNLFLGYEIYEVNYYDENSDRYFSEADEIYKLLCKLEDEGINNGN